jgi:hypothetical protein
MAILPAFAWRTGQQPVCVAACISSVILAAQKQLVTTGPYPCVLFGPLHALSCVIYTAQGRLRMTLQKYAGGCCDGRVDTPCIALMVGLLVLGHTDHTLDLLAG